MLIHVEFDGLLIEGRYSLFVETDLVDVVLFTTSDLEAVVEFCDVTFFNFVVALLPQSGGRWACLDSKLL